MQDFVKELGKLINRHSIENSSNTPDFIMAQYLVGCLEVFSLAIQQRETYYGRDGRPSEQPPAKKGCSCYPWNGVGHQNPCYCGCHAKPTPERWEEAAGCKCPMPHLGPCDLITKAPPSPIEQSEKQGKCWCTPTSKCRPCTDRPSEPMRGAGEHTDRCQTGRRLNPNACWCAEEKPPLPKEECMKTHFWTWMCPICRVEKPREHRATAPLPREVEEKIKEIVHEFRWSGTPVSRKYDALRALCELMRGGK